MMRVTDKAWMDEYGGPPRPSAKCALRDGSCNHRSISDCDASRVRPVDRGPKGAAR